jgi:hypothetical protein
VVGISVDAIIGIVTGVIAICGGVYLTVHELRRRERRVTRREIDDLTDEVQHLIEETDALRALLLEQRRYIYRLVTLMIDAGLDPPHAPAPSFDPGEYDDDDAD